MSSFNKVILIMILSQVILHKTKYSWVGARQFSNMWNKSVWLNIDQKCKFCFGPRNSAQQQVVLKLPPLQWAKVKSPVLTHAADFSVVYSRGQWISMKINANF